MITRAKVKKRERLHIFMSSKSVGWLERENSGAISFGYDTAWLSEQKALPISRRFLLREEPYVGTLVRDYFDNLLPDDRRVRESLAARTQAAGMGFFDLLASVGRDCVGALQFYPEGESPAPLKSVQGQPISHAEIAKLIKNLRMNPLGLSVEGGFRISLAGAQSKTALLKVGDKWFLPIGATPTSHILKPAIGPDPDGPDFSFSIENEWLCLRILRAFGLPVANAEIIQFEAVQVLMVERFDRAWSGKKLHRLPQEDLCQALGIGSERRYESDGGPGIGAILALLNESDRRDEDRKIFMKAQLVYWLLAAIDGHAKNFSLFIRPSGFVLTPLYDVMSADPHINPKTLPLQKIKLAMAVGNNRHFNVREIFPRHWLQTATENGFTGCQKLMDEVGKLAPQAIQEVSQELPKDFPKQVSEPIFAGILERIKRLK